MSETPLVINDNGAWCWFQDDRALVDPVAQVLLVGSVASPQGPGGDHRGGNIEVATYNLVTGEKATHVLHENLESDDHNAPALLIRPDGRYLAMYAKHKTDNYSRFRISVRPHDASAWQAEEVFDWTELADGRGATYSNVYRLSGEGRSYNFVRAVNDDQSIMVSTDDGSSWAYGGKLFTRPKIGYVNGYTRYYSDGEGRIDLVTTDHHPRDFNNNIYHGYLQGNALHASDGTIVNDAILGSDGVNQDQLSVIFLANLVHDGDELTHGWTSDVKRQGEQIAAVISCRANDVNGVLYREQRLDHDDHRLLYATFDGTSWELHPLAQAGAALLPHEQDYTGLGAIDPYDLSHVYVSTPIDPVSGLATEHYEIYSGTTHDDGQSWAWEAITSDSEVDNLRPMVVAGDPRHQILCWFRGEMTSSQDYTTEMVAMIQPRS